MLNRTQFGIQTIALSAVGIAGLAGNMFGIVKFTKLKHQLRFHSIMVALFIYDNLYIACNVLIFALYSERRYGLNESQLAYAVPYAMPLLQIAHTASIYSTLAISVERYMVVCKPFYISRKDWRSNRYRLPILIFSILFNIPKMFELRAWKCSDGKNYVNSTYFKNCTKDTIILEPTFLKSNTDYTLVQFLKYVELT